MVLSSNPSSSSPFLTLISIYETDFTSLSSLYCLCVLLKTYTGREIKVSVATFVEDKYKTM